LPAKAFFFFQNFFSEMRSGLMGFSGPSITGWAYSITGFTLVLMGKALLFSRFLWRKYYKTCPFCLPAACLAAAIACRAALPLPLALPAA
jgi:hypothetical protein